MKLFDDYGLRIADKFDDYDLRIADKEAIHAKWDNIWRLGVVVFTRPEERICKDVIGPSLNYLHELTGEKVHFYFVGFNDDDRGRYKVKAISGLFGDEVDWFFSELDFVKVQENFEQLTQGNWLYSGGTDLLVVPYRIRFGCFYIDANVALDIKLSKLAKKSENYIPEEIVQIIIRQ
ncbi:hypothetical protein LCGC14_1717060 [marine sediment metagenome]|uniref:Uncharacterized protein n=1 Tax=marine sediment metagenome TaxID=412755 RepID=A0A0F9HDS2_9ZZZZ